MVTLASSKDNSASSTASTTLGTNKPIPWPSQRVNGFPAENTFRDLQFKLANNLQSSLDLHTTLELFFNNIQDAVALHGLSYSPPASQKRFTLGEAKIHKANYAISGDNVQLGQIEFSRSKRFLEAELAMLEMMVGVLFYPLRNALLYQQALENSFRDSLTGVGNRSAFDASFDRELKLAQRHQLPLSVMVLDIDHFKQVNDQHGHQHGDRVLKQVAEVLLKALRETDQIFRYGGEEFVILLNNTDLLSATLIAERIRVHIAMTPCPLAGKQTFVSISAGVSQIQATDNGETLFGRADEALYRAKAEGRNCVRSENNVALSSEQAL